MSTAALPAANLAAAQARRDRCAAGASAEVCGTSADLQVRSWKPTDMHGRIQGGRMETSLHIPRTKSALIISRSGHHVAPLLRLKPAQTNSCGPSRRQPCCQDCVVCVGQKWQLAPSLDNFTTPRIAAQVLARALLHLLTAQGRDADCWVPRDAALQLRCVAPDRRQHPLHGAIPAALHDMYDVFVHVPRLR